jgi:hypothetical protein
MPTTASTRLVFCCRPDNDLYRLLSRQRRLPRYDTPESAIVSAPEGSGLLLLAEGYPAAQTHIDAGLLNQAVQKHLRLYVEYPDWLPDRAVGAPVDAHWERAVVATSEFGASLPAKRILMLHNCRYLPVKAEDAPLVLARVAGYDTAVFGLPSETHPLLFEGDGGILVATTRLSRFVTGRSAPADAWAAVWKWILDQLEPGGSGHLLAWTPSVHPDYPRSGSLPVGAETRALRRGAEWYSKARMLVHPAWADKYDTEARKWPDRVGPMPSQSWPTGDGSLGLLEGFNSSISPGGTQPVRWWRRADCIGETVGALALAGAALKSPSLSHIAGNLGDWLYKHSILTAGKRADPQDPAFGLVGWNDVAHYYGDMDGYGVYYGDDQARSMLGMMMAASALKSDRWNDRLAECLLANLRLTGRRGFLPDRINEDELEKSGWRPFAESDAVSYSPHYQAYMWACFLRASASGGNPRFLQSAKRGIEQMMAAYPQRWNYTNASISLEQARFLLALAWLVRVEDTPEHRGWLRRIATDLLKKQDACGAIREEIVAASGYLPTSNQAYGTSETPLIQENGDPAADLLYTVNFALLGLHEAAAATGEAVYKQAEDRLADFLCRVQARSTDQPEFDGAWFRAFDFGRWEYWASNADAGWGAWSVESGWTQSWITSVLALRKLRLSLWDITSNPNLGSSLQRISLEKFLH